MSEMIERVARALCRCRGVEEATFPDTLDGWIERYWPQFTDDAHAALEAMREPTGAMQDAADDHIGAQGTAGNAEKVWAAMIQAALTETQGAEDA